MMRKVQDRQMMLGEVDISQIKLGVIRLNCDWNYDKLKEMADNHLALRKMLGHSLDCMKDPKYPLQTLKDNVGLLTPELLDAINVLVVQGGQNLVKKKRRRAARTWRQFRG